MAYLKYFSAPNLRIYILTLYLWCCASQLPDDRVVTTIAGNGTAGHRGGLGTQSLLTSPQDIAFGADGSYFLATCANNIIWKYDFSSSTISTVAGQAGVSGHLSGTGTSTKFHLPIGIARHPTDNYFLVADYSNRRIRRVASDTYEVSTVAGTGAQATVNGVGTSASFYSPWGVVISSDGTIAIISEYNGHTLRKMMLDTYIVSTFAGNGTLGYADGVSTLAMFYSPTFMAFTTDGSNSLLVSDYRNHVIRHVDLVSGSVGTYCGVNIAGDVDGNCATAKFNRPMGISMSATGEYILIAEELNPGVRKILTSSSTVTTLAGEGVAGLVDGPLTSARFRWPRGINLSPDETIAIVADEGNDALRQVDIFLSTASPTSAPTLTQRIVTTLAGSTSSGHSDGLGTNALLNGPFGVAIAPDDSYFLVSDNFNHVIRLYVFATGAMTTLAGSPGNNGYGDGFGTNVLFSNPCGIVFHPTDNYALIADQDGHRIRKISMGNFEVTTVAGSGVYGSTDGTGTDASFGYPFGIAMSPDGAFVVVSDLYGHMLRKMTISTKVVVTLAGSGTVGSTDGAATSAEFNRPSHLAMSSDGSYVLVADQSNNLIRYVQISTGDVSTYCGRASLISGFVNGDCTSAAFDFPTGIAISPGEIYVLIADQKNNVIRKVDMATKVVNTLSGSGAAGFGDGSLLAAVFNSPADIAISHSGEFALVADNLNNRIRRLTQALQPTPLPTPAPTHIPTTFPTAQPTLQPSISQRSVFTLIGSGTQGLDDGVGTASQLFKPYGLDVSPDETFALIADTNNHAIRKFTFSTMELTTIAGWTTSGYANGAGTNARFFYPLAVSIHPSGTYALITDQDNNRLRHIDYYFNVVTLIGNGAASSIDSTGTSATLNAPWGVDIHPSGGFALVAEGNGHKLRKVDLSTYAVTTLAGTGSQGNIDGVSTLAKFNTPSGVTISPSGEFVLVADRDNSLIRKVIIETGTVSTYCGSTTLPGLVDGDCLSDARLYESTGVAFGPNNDFVLVADKTNGVIRKIDTNTMFINTLAGTGTNGYSNGLLLSSQFDYPIDVDVLSNGAYALVVDTRNSVIRNVMLLDAPTVSPTRAPTNAPTSIKVTTIVGDGLPGHLTGIGTNARLHTPNDIVFARDDSYILFSDTMNNVIRKYDFATAAVSLIAGDPGISGGDNGAGTNARFSAPCGVAVHPSADVAFVADYSNHKIRRIDLTDNSVTDFAGDGSVGGTDAIGVGASFNGPWGIDVTPDGTYMVVSEHGGHRLRRITMSTRIVELLAGSGLSGHANGVGTSASFTNPTGISINHDGSFVLVAGNNDHGIRHVSISTGLALSYCGTLGTSGSGNGACSSATFLQPLGVAMAPSDVYVLVADTENDVIRKITTASDTVDIFSGTGSVGSNDGDLLASSFNTPYSIKISNDGTLAVVVDTNNHILRQIRLVEVPTSVPTATPSSQPTLSPTLPLPPTHILVTTIVGDGTYGYAAGSGTAARLASPHNAEFSPDDSYLFIADTANHIIRKYVFATGAVEVWCGNPVTAGFVDGTAAQFYMPRQVAFHPTDSYALVTDSSNNRIRKVNTVTKFVSTVAGNALAGYSDGGGTWATFNLPWGIDISPDGSFAVVSEYMGYTVRKIILSNMQVTTLAGSGSSGHTDGVGTLAAFGTVGGISISPTGDFALVTENNKFLIRWVSTVDGTVSTMCGTSGGLGYVNGACIGEALLNQPLDVTIAPSGDYALVADASNHVIRILDKNEETLFSFAGTGDEGNQDGRLPYASFTTPYSVSISHDETLAVVTDCGSHTIRQIRLVEMPTSIPTQAPTTRSNFVSTLVSGLNEPGDVVFSHDNSFILFVELVHHAVRKYVFSSAELTTLAGNGAAGYIDAIGTSARFNGATAVALHPVDNYALVTDYYNNRVRKLNMTSMLVTTLAGSGAGDTLNGVGTAAAFYNPWGIDISPDGSYALVCEFSGHRVRRVDLASFAVTIVAGSGISSYGDGTGTFAHFSTPIYVTIAPEGTFALVSDHGNSVIRRVDISSTVVTTYCGSSSLGSVDGACSSIASFRNPVGTAFVGNSGFVVVADRGNHVIRLINTYDMTTVTYAGDGNAGLNDDVLSAAQFHHPYGVAVSENEAFVVVADWSNDKLRRVPLILPSITSFPTAVPTAIPSQSPTITPTSIPTAAPVSTKVVSTLVGSGIFGSDNGPASSAKFKGPYDMAYSSDFSSLYIADSNTHRIRKYVFGSHLVSTLAGGTQGYVNAAGTSASFDGPVGVAVDPTSGDVLVADFGNLRIRKISSATLEVTTLAGSGLSGSMDDTGESANFHRPWGIAVSSDGSFAIVSDYSGHNIRKINLATDAVTTLAGYGVEGFNDGYGTNAQFRNPTYLVLSSDDASLFIADSGNHVLRHVDISSGAVSTLCGSPNTAGLVNGACGTARFRNLRGIALTSDENTIYIGDSGNDVIRAINVSTLQVTTLAGSGTIGFDNGPLLSSTFSDPRAVRLSSDETYLIVADSSNNVLRLIDLVETPTLAPTMSPSYIPTVAVETVTTIAGSEAGFEDGPALSSKFRFPFDICIGFDESFAVIAESMNNVIRKYDIVTESISTLAGQGGITGFSNGVETTALFNFPTGISCHRSVSGAYIADKNNRRVRYINISSREVTTIAGNSNAGILDGAGTDAQFYNPISVCLSADSTFLLVGEFDAHVIRKVVIATQEVTTIVGSPGSSGFLNGVGSHARLNKPVGISISSDDMFALVCDTPNHAIRKIDLVTYEVSNYCGVSGKPGLVNGHCSSVATKFNAPIFVRFLHDDSHVLVADTSNHVIRVIDAVDMEVLILAGSTTGVSGDADGSYFSSRFSGVRGIAVSHDSTFALIADSGNNRLRRIELSLTTLQPTSSPTSSFDVISIAGSSYGFDDGTATLAKFRSPRAVAYSSDSSYIIIADGNNHLIRRLNTVTSQVTTLAGKALTSGFVDAVGTSAEFYHPMSLAVHSSGAYCLIADQYNERIRMLTLSTMVVSTLVGDGSTTGIDGSGTAASLNKPSAVAFFPDMFRVLIAESGGHRLRLLNMNTLAVTTLAGSGSSGYADQAGTVARFSQPCGMAIAPSGDFVLVADSDNNVIRKVIIDSGVTSTYCGASNIPSVGDGACLSTARFNAPKDVIFSRNGRYVFVTDYNNNKIRYIVDGVAHTLVGSGAGGLVEGSLSIAELENPFGLEMSADNSHILVAAKENNRILKISVTSLTYTPTSFPTSSPTSLPSSVPSNIPSACPTFRPSSNPTSAPTAPPSISNRQVVTIAGNGSGDYINGIGTAASLKEPHSIAINSLNSFLLVADHVNHAIRKIDLSTLEVTTIIGNGAAGLADGDIATARLNYPTFIAIKSDDSFALIVDFSSNRIRRLDLTTNMLSTVAGSGAQSTIDGTGTSATFNRPWGITISSLSEMVYVTELAGSSIRSIDMNTGAVVTMTKADTANLQNGVGTNAHYFQPTGITLSHDETYLLIADRGNCVIRKLVLSTQVSSTLCGFSTSPGSSDGACASEASFTYPRGVEFSPDGSYVLVADTDQHTLRKIDMTSMVVNTLSGTGIAGSNDGDLLVASYNYPTATAITSDGSVAYVADRIANKIRKVMLLEAPTSIPTVAPTITDDVMSLAGTGDADFLDGVGPLAKMSSPYDVCIVPDMSYVLVTDSDNHVIRKYTFGFGELTTVSGLGETSGFVDGIGSEARLYNPAGIACHPSGNYVLVSDLWNYRMRMYNTTNGMLSTVSGNGTASSVDGVGAASSLNHPWGVAIAATGEYALICEWSGNRLRRLDLATWELTTVAGRGNAGYANGVGTNAEFHQPISVSISPSSDYALVVDFNLHVIRRVDVNTGVVSLYCGSSAGFADGDCGSAQFQFPRSVAFTPNGKHVLVSDRANEVIRVIYTPTKVVSLYAGNVGVSGDMDGSLLEAKFRKVYGMSIAADGSFAILADTNNHKIKRLSLNLPTIAPSSVPTSMPTSSPSSLPSSTPTSDPSLSPTTVPTSHPTNGPTAIPSGIPTSSPTSIPSVLPSSAPSGVPTSIPSARPSSVPSGVPSSAPSSVPSSAPSSIPSSIPSVPPSSVPSGVPSSAPSSIPSSIPSVPPSSVPSGVPSSAPSSIPSSIPSVPPSSVPSGVPSGAPSSIPSIPPSSVPSSAPSSAPSCTPSACPSATPTTMPSSGPSSAPSSTPSSSPSSAPTAPPTCIPSSFPTTIPTGIPSSIPSVTPTSSPTSLPTTYPSGLPSAPPTSIPSHPPTAIPSSLPSCLPTNVPSAMPTGVPLSNPSSTPTAIPSSMPSVIPTLQPSSIPTSVPSNIPSATPTTAPSSMPSQLPTSFPTNSPSAQPSFSPTSVPTTCPTACPSAMPTSFPSFSPSSVPTISPTSEPTPLPTQFPTMDGTFGSINVGGLGARGMSIYGKSGYQVGSSVVGLGDINNDGIDDVLVGTPFSLDQIGAAFVVYGQEGGCADIFLEALNHKLGFAITGDLSGGLLGFTGAGLGDINGDGVGDFAVSAPFANGGAGVVYVIFGMAGYRESIILQVMPSTIGFKIIGHVSSGNAGYSVAGIEDINGDNVPDMLVSVPYADETRGRTYVIFGLLLAEYSDINLGSLGSESGVVLRGSQIGCKSGFKVITAGDVNGDGVNDFAVGEPFAGKFSAGTVKIIYGKRHNGYANDIYLSDMENWGITVVGSGAYSRLGITINKAGDVNRDGVDDIIMSSFVANNLRGEVYVVYGSHILGDVDLSNLLKTQGFMLRGTGGSYFGMSITGLADVNHDGVPDLIVADSAPLSERVGYGVVSSPSLYSSNKNIENLSERDFIALLLQPQDDVHFSDIGDFDHDGFADFVVATSSSQYDGTAVGALHIIYDIFADTVEEHFTHSPVISPTYRPTRSPSSKPTEFPTSRPTLTPTAPTQFPTRTPTRSPNSTPNPTVAPTALPTQVPSLSPTKKPTMAPTQRPSHIPTLLPTPMPTCVPSTSQPSNIPSHEPSYAPNITPRPTSLPTLFPTSHPTTRPTSNPTSMPSFIPSCDPTSSPTIAPTSKPTAPPTNKPTKLPTSSPSIHPTFFPTGRPTNNDGYSVIIVNSCGEHSGSNGNDEIIVETDSDCPVTLTGGLGHDIYVVKSHAKAVLNIEDFDLQTDRIDLTLIPGIRSMHDLNMTRGSVIIHLPSLQRIVLLHCDPSDMTKHHFIFASSRTTSNNTLMGAAFIVFIAVMACSTTCFLYKANKELEIWDTMVDLWDAKKKIAPDSADVEHGDLTGVLPTSGDKSPSKKSEISIPLIHPENRELFSIEELMDVSSDSSDDLDDAASDYYDIDSSDESSDESNQGEKNENSSSSNVDST